MQLKVLGSNSNGNCYILDSGEECLILDAGVSPKEIKISLGFNVTKISGALITHLHSPRS